MTNKLVPELSISDWQRSQAFYRDVLGFETRFARPEEGFCYLAREGAEIMLDQLGQGRDFRDASGLARPFGRGMNLQIETRDVAGLAEVCAREGADILLPLETRWYRTGAQEQGNRQFIVADPDGYLLRFFQDLGNRPSQRGR